MGWLSRLVNGWWRQQGPQGDDTPEPEPVVMIVAPPEPDNLVELNPPGGRIHRIHPATMALVEEMSSYAEFVEVMQRHLHNVCNETQDAAENILGQALDVEGSVSDLVRHVSTTMQSDQFVEAAETLQISVDAGRGIISDLIHQHHTTQREIRDSISTMHMLSDKMKSHLREIEDIRRYTDLLAINARIRIAGLGSNTGLEVIAEEIRELSSNTGALAQNLRSELGEMDRLISEDLLARVTGQELADEARARDLQDSFESLSNHMSMLSRMQEELLTEVHLRGEAVRDPLNTLCGSIQFQDVARQQLEQVGRALNMISDHFVALSNAIIHDDAPPDSSIATCLSNILENYVMEQQRAAHVGGASAAAPRIELF
ncbi:methyl-accepting chemotaxis protein [Novosphingobium umbonatum]|uniref:Methyl-accepting chemotaxis protein n=1 Tax=Novosphingobium umbonatum TaxID=1908524 RepID=A0A3S2X5M6_9SPHN|nr:methyl-accepting chemotaxis protein [Novosphingobium umbonatum]RVU06329.1 methyl-accepting chemotaxis protein [Novosphingobium umbonatum]